MRILVVVPSSPEMPSGIVRVEQFLPRLRAMGFECEVIHYFAPPSRRRRWRAAGVRRLGAAGGAVAAAAAALSGTWQVWRARLRILLASRTAEAVVIQWITPPVWLSRWLATGRARFVYDFDDAVHLVNGASVDAAVRAAWRVVVGSHALYDYAAPLNPATVLVPSAIALDGFQPVARERDEPAARPLRVGWIGSASTLPYLAELAAPLERLARRGVAVQLVVAGTQGRDDLLPAIPGVEIVPIASYTGAEMPAIAAAMDVGVLPIPDGPWERGKCAMKALVYMAARLPVVCSRVGENVHVVADGESGFHASGADEWEAALLRLAQDAALRGRQGARGREIVEHRFSTDVCFAQLVEHVYGPLRASAARARPSAPGP